MSTIIIAILNILANVFYSISVVSIIKHNFNNIFSMVIDFCIKQISIFHSNKSTILIMISFCENFIQMFKKCFMVIFIINHNININCATICHNHFSFILLFVSFTIII